MTLPDGTPIRAASLADRCETDAGRDFGLPAAPDEAAAQIRAAFERAQAGQRVEIGCLGGLGRTGTVLACIVVLAGVPAAHAVAWVRANYTPAAVETPEQAEWVAWFAATEQLRPAT